MSVASPPSFLEIGEVEYGVDRGPCHPNSLQECSLVYLVALRRIAFKHFSNVFGKYLRVLLAISLGGRPRIDSTA